MKRQATRSNHEESANKALKDLSDCVGDFIRYWGFRRIHGQLWTQIFLSRDSLNGKELCERLKVSKALVSPALNELEQYGLVICLAENDKIKRYIANPDLFQVIQNILKDRELKLISETQKNLSILKRKKADDFIDPERLDRLEQMTSSASVAIQFITQNTTEEDFKIWTEIIPSLSKSEP